VVDRRVPQESVFSGVSLCGASFNKCIVCRRGGWGCFRGVQSLSGLQGSSCCPHLVFQAERASFIPKIFISRTSQQQQSEGALAEEGLAEQSAGMYPFGKTF